MTSPQGLLDLLVSVSTLVSLFSALAERLISSLSWASSSLSHTLPPPLFVVFYSWHWLPGV